MKSKIIIWAVVMPFFLFAGTQPKEQEKGGEQSLPKTLIIKVKMNQQGQEQQAFVYSTNFDKQVTNEQLAQQANLAIQQQGTEFIDLREKSTFTSPNEVMALFDLQNFFAVDPIRAVDTNRSTDEVRWNYYGNHGFYGYGYYGYYGYRYPYHYRHANYGYWSRNLFYPFRSYGYYYPYGGYYYYYYYNPYYY